MEQRIGQEGEAEVVENKSIANAPRHAAPREPKQKRNARRVPGQRRCAGRINRGGCESGILHRCNSRTLRRQGFSAGGLACSCRRGAQVSAREESDSEPRSAARGAAAARSVSSEGGAGRVPTYSSGDGGRPGFVCGMERLSAPEIA
ncbi:Protein of unknown function [Gryllus bimaculatus]|nr:Protein of unknown function [Gryllus bimaculatus]